MTIKKVKYSKEFISQTYQKDTSYHGSPDWEDFQRINKEDEKLREEINKKFALHRIDDIYKLVGFDGKQGYTYWIRDELGLSIKSSSKNVKYSTNIKIKKAGAEEQLNELCDLESFLIENKFKKLD